MIVKTASKTNTYHPCIVVYADGHSSTYLLMQRLKESFGKAANVIQVKAHHILNQDIPKNTIRFILPGTPQGSSSYRDQLGQRGFSLIRRWNEQGMDYEGHCAGAYLAMAEFSYLYDSGELREMITDLPLAEGRAYGPALQYTKKERTAGRYNGYSLALIDFTNAAGTPDTAGMLYSSGPLLELYPHAEGDYDILGRFKDLPGQPIAALRRNDIGRGTATLISFPPEMGVIAAKENPGNDDPFRVSQLGQDFFDTFQPWNDSRRRFWNDVVVAPTLLRLKEEEAHLHVQPA